MTAVQDRGLLVLIVPRTRTAEDTIQRGLDALAPELPVTALGTAQLLARELTSNAVSHGDGAVMRLMVRRSAEALRVEVKDAGDGFPTPRRPGRGLRLVEALAARWGIEPGASCVWFELPLAA